MQQQNKNIFKPLFFDPSKINSQMKQQLATMTITQAKVGSYKAYPQPKTQIFNYVENSNIIEPNNICFVDVLYDHAIDIASVFALKCSNKLSQQTKPPLVLNVIGKMFNGENIDSNLNIRDEIINIRTNFCCSINNTIIKSLPLKDNQCMYSNNNIVIKSKDAMNFYNYDQSYVISIVSISPVETPQPNLLPNNRMNIEDYVKTCTKIETLFQLAIAGEHKILLLTPFGHTDEFNPIEDIIKIYNYNICKYGHLFDKILFCIPPHYPKTAFDLYCKNIIKPHQLVEEIDKKFEQEKMAQKFLNLSKKT